MNILRSQSVGTEKRYTYTVLFGVLKQESPVRLVRVVKYTMNIFRSQSVGTEKRYTYTVLFGVLKQESPVRLVRVVKQWFTRRTIGELHRYLHTNDKQFCRTYTTREWLERQTCYSNAPKRKTR